MAVGWAKDGAVQEQIDAGVADAVKRARSRLGNGESRTHCDVCEEPIPEARRNALPGVRLCVQCQTEMEIQPLQPPGQQRQPAEIDRTSVSEPWSVKERHSPPHTIYLCSFNLCLSTRLPCT